MNTNLVMFKRKLSFGFVTDNGNINSPILIYMHCELSHSLKFKFKIEQ